MRLNPLRGSHLPVLMKIVQQTEGPILELGCGTYSTQYLHWACYPIKRRLVTYESNPDYYEYIQQFARDFHEVRCIDNWNAVDLSEPWTVAFVDHDPGPRGLIVQQLVHAEYVVCHDTERRAARGHRYAEAFARFEYQWRYREARPNTTILSNIHDVTRFTIP